MKKKFIDKGVNKNSNILEIGPNSSPLYPKSEGYNTEIIDYLDEVNLRKKCSKVEDVNRIEKVDYICSRHYADIIKKYKFYDIIAASHVIEHLIDVIEFFNDCSQLLKENGKIKLIVPDKRYEFDYFKEETSIRNVIDQHIYRKDSINHSLGTAVESIFNSVHIENFNTYIPNSALIYKEDMKFSWDRNDVDIVTKLSNTIDNYKEKEYTDRHSWFFTPKSFEILIYQLNILGYIDLMLEEIITVKNSIEFYVILKKGKEIFNGKYLTNLYIAHKKEYIESWSNYYELMQMIDDGKKLYIFGTGKSANKVIRFLEILNISYIGHIVSDGYKKASSYNTHPIYEIKEIKDLKNICILLGISSEFRNEVCTALDELKINYIF